MRASVGGRFLAAALALMWALESVHSVADIRAADRAFSEEDHDRALALYEEVLADDPDNVHALVRSGLLLSLKGRYKAALERYEHALVLGPENREAALERARVLSWDGQHAAAELAFRELLTLDPDDADARLGLARTLSLSGRQNEARAEFEKVLALDPDSPEVMVGIARTYALSGAGSRARAWYERALTVEPGMKDAELGLAYLDLAAGRHDRARARASILARRFPDDDDVKDLQEAVRRKRGPWVRATAERLTDTADNVLGVVRFEAGWPLPARTAMTFGLSRYEMEDAAGATASVSSAYGVLGWQPAGDHRFDFRFGVDDREPSTAKSTAEPVGGANWFWSFSPTWELRLGARRSTFIYSVDILDGPANTIDVYDVTIGGHPAERWRTDAGLGTWNISDGNRRQNADAGFWYQWVFGESRIETGYRFRYVNYDESLDNGYFDPQDYAVNLAQLRASGKFGANEYYYDVGIEAGFESFTLDGIDVDNEQVAGLNARMGFPIGGGAAVEVFATISNVALATPGGFGTRQFGVRVRWQGGP